MTASNARIGRSVQTLPAFPRPFSSFSLKRLSNNLYSR